MKVCSLCAFWIRLLQMLALFFFEPESIVLNICKLLLNLGRSTEKTIFLTRLAFLQRELSQFECRTAKTKEKQEKCTQRNRTVKFTCSSNYCEIMEKVTVVRCCDLCHFETIVQTESEVCDFEGHSSEKSAAGSGSQINSNNCDSPSSATSAEKEILKIIFSCLLPSNSPSAELAQNHHGFPSLKLCSTCKLLLNFWWKTEKTICELQLESRRLKSSLISRILQGMPNSDSEFLDARCHKSNSVLQLLHQIRHRLWQGETRIEV